MSSKYRKFYSFLEFEMKEKEETEIMKTGQGVLQGNVKILSIEKCTTNKFNYN